ncbi:MAG: energy transducer TonB [Lentimicrobiaceae bacterium]|nr:energy transducer TonB [Lentimicrobiaceae bacterium]
MVRFLLFFLMLFSTLSLVGQGNCDTTPHRDWYDFPIFDKSAPNDFEKLNEFLKENLNYPETAKADKVEGMVFVEYWIDTLGFTTEHKIIQSVRQDLDDEALRVTKLIKYDVPAKNNGKPIGICYMRPIRFRLSDPEFLLFKKSEKDKEKSKKQMR